MSLKQWQLYLTNHGVKPTIITRLIADTMKWQKKKPSNCVGAQNEGKENNNSI